MDRDKHVELAQAGPPAPARLNAVIIGRHLNASMVTCSPDAGTAAGAFRYILPGEPLKSALGFLVFSSEKSCRGLGKT